MKNILIQIAIRILRKYRIFKFKEIEQGFFADRHYYEVEVDREKLRKNIENCVGVI